MHRSRTSWRPKTKRKILRAARGEKSFPKNNTKTGSRILNRNNEIQKI